MKDLRTEIENVLWQNDSSPDLVMYRTRVLDALLPLFQQHMEAVAVKVEAGKIDMVARHKQLCGAGGNNKTNRRLRMKEAAGWNEAKDDDIAIIRAAKNN